MHDRTGHIERRRWRPVTTPRKRLRSLLQRNSFRPCGTGSKQSCPRRYGTQAYDVHACSGALLGGTSPICTTQSHLRPLPDQGPGEEAKDASPKLLLLDLGTALPRLPGPRPACAAVGLAMPLLTAAAAKPVVCVEPGVVGLLLTCTTATALSLLCATPPSCSLSRRFCRQARTVAQENKTVADKPAACQRVSMQCAAQRLHIEA